MADLELTTPLLQLRQPKLIATGDACSTVTPRARRRGRAAAAGTITATFPPPSNATTPHHTSLAARKLHDAKSTARQVLRDKGDNAGASSAKTTVKASALASSPTVRLNERSNTASPTSWAAAVDSQRLHGAAATTAGSATSSSSASATLHTGQNTAPTGAGCRRSHPTRVTAAASSPDTNLSVNLPYLMRHIHDTAALLDMLFPLQRPSFSSHANGGALDTEEDEVVCVQTVSAAPAFREDVIALHAKLCQRLEVRRARPVGLCGIRRSIYTDLFSELVRQVTVEEPARGLLLARVRENEEHSLQVHAALLREGEQFVAEKLLQDTHRTTELSARLSALQQDKVALEVERHRLQEVRAALERRFEEERQGRRAQQQADLNYLRRANQQLSLRLKAETERASAGGVGGHPDDRSATANTNGAAATSEKM